MSQPTLKFEPQILLKAQGESVDGIRAVIFDIDGVFTDGTLYYTELGETIKAFSVLDGQGLNLLKMAGIQPIVITGRDSPALRRRLADLGIDYAYYNIKNKLKAAQEVLQKLNLSWAQIAVIGDDWPDIPLFKRAAFSVAPLNGHTENRALADYVTQAKGGQGAVRELCDLLLIAGAHYDRLFELMTILKDEVEKV